MADEVEDVAATEATNSKATANIPIPASSSSNSRHRRTRTRDSGATSHFLVTDAPVIDILPASLPLTVQIPNGERVLSTHTYNLDMPHLPQKSRQGHIMPGLASHSLLSVTKLCNAGYKVEFTMIGCTITHRGRTIVCGKKCTRTGLWMIPIAAKANPNNGTITNQTPLLP